MSKILKLSSITLLSSTLAVSYYYYAIDRDGYHYNNSIWKRISDRTRGIIDRKQDIVATDPFTTKPRDILRRPMVETMKDLWNEQIRSSVSWIYSLGK
ncbi:hypothetical protein HG535_0C04750 [Zygotorulaspora mrakii]|uniref:MICOS complex subunit MIC12 n=1 Tax=Zygotorulaspora mrakii TaxID=42260 RepID=A0A7H9B0H8_ZYGMR|nr:uncharacterized protein HG535_0C04750 [Zygotorulaspora mrakii]QLG72121.1 hypothetical protein HG535_0C04750 [Zygotorulaspora mrakii]